MLKKYRHHRPDAIALVALLLLWLLFFWRLFTPVFEDQASLRSGDFSGQFVAFGAYQFERFKDGEVPLWNPYNNGGLPFIADTQAAVFYPPRLLTITLSDTWTYNALQIEMTLHVLLYTCLMYTFIRRLTIGNGVTSVFAGFVGAIIAGYGGYMTGYPPVQLALLEAAIWLPLALLGVLEATRHQKIIPLWLVLSGFALGISWMAGHPQTSWFATYFIVAYLAYRVWTQKHRWWWVIAGTAIIGTITVGLAAVQLLPGFEYLSRTMRAGFGFDAKSGGFPFHDLLQIIFPGVMSLYSPLFVGISGLILAVIGLFSNKTQDRLFWGVTLVLALGLSFGGNGALYHALYNLLPGLSFFRGQERAAFLVSNILAIVAGFGIVALFTVNTEQLPLKTIRRGIISLLVICGLLTGGVFVMWLADRVGYDAFISPMVFSTLMAGVVLFIFAQYNTSHRTLTLWLLAGLVVFELFSVNIDSDANYEPIPASQQPVMTPPPLVEQVLADDDTPFRVEGGIVRGWIGVYGGGNTGTLYGIADIRGISPLFLDGPHAIIQRELPSEVAWELFAVRYIFSDAEDLFLPSEIVARDFPDGEVLNLHLLDNPRPFAHLTNAYVLAESDEAARDFLRDPNFTARETVILGREPTIPLPDSPANTGTVTITDYAPERFTITVNTPENALLSVAHVDYPGWEVTINDQPIEIIRAYGALTALEMPAGEHTITFVYDPLTYRIGAILSLATWLSLGILGVILIIRWRYANNQ